MEREEPKTLGAHLRSRSYFPADKRKWASSRHASDIALSYIDQVKHRWREPDYPFSDEAINTTLTWIIKRYGLRSQKLDGTLRQIPRKLLRDRISRPNGRTEHDVWSRGSEIWSSTALDGIRRSSASYIENFHASRLEDHLVLEKFCDIQEQLSFLESRDPQLSTSSRRISASSSAATDEIQIAPSREVSNIRKANAESTSSFGQQEKCESSGQAIVRSSRQPPDTLLSRTSSDDQSEIIVGQSTLSHHPGGRERTHASGITLERRLGEAQRPSRTSHTNRAIELESVAAGVKRRRLTTFDSAETRGKLRRLEPLPPRNKGSIQVQVRNNDHSSLKSPEGPSYLESSKAQPTVPRLQFHLRAPSVDSVGSSTHQVDRTHPAGPEGGNVPDLKAFKPLLGDISLTIRGIVSNIFVQTGLLESHPSPCFLAAEGALLSMYRLCFGADWHSTFCQLYRVKLCSASDVMRALIASFLFTEIFAEDKCNAEADDPEASRFLPEALALAIQPHVQRLVAESGNFNTHPIDQLDHDTLRLEVNEVVEKCLELRLNLARSGIAYHFDWPMSGESLDRHTMAPQLGFSLRVENQVAFTCFPGLHVAFGPDLRVIRHAEVVARPQCNGLGDNAAAKSAIHASADPSSNALRPNTTDNAASGLGPSSKPENPDTSTGPVSPGPMNVDYSPPISSLDETSNRFSVKFKGVSFDLSDDPERHVLHPQEVEIASRLRMSCIKYKQVKQQIFAAKVQAQAKKERFTSKMFRAAAGIRQDKAVPLMKAFNAVGWLDDHWFTKWVGAQDPGKQ